mgnify:CR=1 FL=1
MDIHPIIVHFPIALLAVYSVMELVRAHKLLAEKSWYYIKSAFLILGTLGAFAALSTGENAEHINRPAQKIVEMHQVFASASTWIFSILSILYLVGILENILGDKLQTSKYEIIRKIWNIKLRIRNKLFKPVFLIPLAILGLVAIMTTGALGGAMVYGSSADPFVEFVYKILIGQ